MTPNKPGLAVRNRIPIRKVRKFNKVKVIPDMNNFYFSTRFPLSKTFGTNKLWKDSLTKYLANKVELFEDSYLGRRRDPK